MMRLAVQSAPLTGLLLAAVLAPSSVSATPQTRPAPSVAPLSRADVEEITDQIACMCGCTHMQVTACVCPVADQVRLDVAAQLDEGLSEEQIIAAYVEEHSEAALVLPPARGFHLLFWAFPACLLLGGALLVVWLGRRFAAAPAEQAEEAPVAGDDSRYHQQVADLLDQD